MNQGRVLIDAGNLRVGGGVQVAASFLDELASASLDASACNRFPWLSSVTVEATPLVLRNMVSTASSWTPRIVDRTWRSGVGTVAWKKSYDVEFNIFGPAYSVRRGRVRIAGFADGTSLFESVVARPGRGVASVKARLRREVSRRFYRSLDGVVVEAPHVKSELIERWGLQSDQIYVVRNTVNSVFRSPSRWQPVVLPEESFDHLVCYVTRAYPHKNLGLLGRVAEILRNDHGLSVGFVLTLTAREWEAQPPELRRSAINLGPLDIAQVPTVYGSSDAVIFPSLLESFSATPLEALAMNRPLAASDRAFVRDFIGDAASYFDPHDAHSAAKALAHLLTSSEERERNVTKGGKIAAAFTTAKDRAWDYMQLIDSFLQDSRLN